MATIVFLFACRGFRAHPAAPYRLRSKASRRRLLGHRSRLNASILYGISSMEHWQKFQSLLVFCHSMTALHLFYIQHRSPEASCRLGIWGNTSRLLMDRRVARSMDLPTRYWHGNTKNFSGYSKRICTKWFAARIRQTSGISKGAPSGSLVRLIERTNMLGRSNQASFGSDHKEITSVFIH